MNPFKDVNWNPDLAERRKFGRSLVIGFPLLALVWLTVGRLRLGVWHVEAALLMAGIGCAAGLLFIMVPVVAKPFYVVWYFFACCIGLVIGNLLLAIVFYALVTIVGLAKRSFDGRSFRKAPDRSTPSYWQDANQAVDPQSYYRQF